ncbi:sugar ABC transporter permease [Vallitalea pronyensis]|uniref:Sugar ABC transporter permease n=1 Tax=Vallitalea pronyensis TaxID=1348613 RepID=A0A8J8MPQ4_9FIRM|nr:ABC transporter permease subunit [Vallitalea pronyensis]QUI25339.1 sugar ABC transporter permease [Vallitalea pronyensis]
MFQTIKGSQKHFKRYGPIYLLALPGIVLMIVFRYLPMAGLSLAFTNFTAGMRLPDVTWVGFKWFRILFAGDEFSGVVMNTLIISFAKLIFSFPAPIILAILLNEMKSNKMKRGFQTVLYLPHFLAWTVLAGILFTLMSPQTGIVGYFGLKESVFLNSNMFRPLLVVSDIWKTSGWGTIVYLAAISGIDPNLYEAAMIDGANRFQRIRYILIPSIMKTAVILLILKIGHILDAGFDQVFMLYNPAVYDVGDILGTYVFRTAMSQGRFALATASGLFKSFVGLTLIISSNFLAKRVDKDAGLF